MPCAAAASTRPWRQSRTVPKTSKVRRLGRSMASPARAEGYRFSSEPRSHELRVRFRPRAPEALLGFGGFLRLPLCAERLRESVERPPRLGVAREIFTIHRFRVRRAPRREERGTEGLASRLLPRRRLVIVERVLHSGCGLEELDGLIVVPAPERDLAREVRGGEAVDRRCGIQAEVR